MAVKELTVFVTEHNQRFDNKIDAEIQEAQNNIHPHLMAVYDYNYGWQLDEPDAVGDLRVLAEEFGNLADKLEEKRKAK